MNNKEVKQCRGKNKKIIFIDSGVTSKATCIDVSGKILPVTESNNAHADLCISAFYLLLLMQILH